MRGRHAGVAEGKVAHVQLVDRHVGLRAHAVRARCRVPAFGFQRGRIEVGHVTAPRVGGQADRIRIGHPVAHDAQPAHVHVHQVGVVAAGQVVGRAPRPGTGVRVAHQVVYRLRRRVAAAVQADRHRLRGGRPQAEGRRPAGDARAQVRQPGRGGIQVVQCAGELQGGAVQHAAGRVLLHQQHLPTQPVRKALRVRRTDHEIGAGRHEAETFGQRGWQRRGRTRQRHVTIGTGDLAAARGDQRGVFGVMQPVAAIGRLAWPAQGTAVEPVGGRLVVARRGRAGLQSRRVIRRVAGGPPVRLTIVRVRRPGQRGDSCRDPAKQQPPAERRHTLHLVLPRGNGFSARLPTGIAILRRSARSTRHAAATTSARPPASPPPARALRSPAARVRPAPANPPAAQRG